MSYIVTTKERYPSHDSTAPFGRILSRHAVATLDEARKAAFDEAVTEDDWGDLTVKLMGLVEHGGTIGPLSNGIVIEVEQVSPLMLASRCGVSSEAIMRSLRADDGFAAVINAYNAAQGS